MESLSTKKEESSGSDEFMTVKIQTLDNLFPLKLKMSSTVQDLKEKIFESYNIPLVRQRLIFQGKQLQTPNDKLKNLRIGEGSVVHLVARALEENNQSTQNTQGSTSNADASESRHGGEELFPSLLELPIIRTSRRQRRRRIPHFDISECFESMHQNLSTMQNLVNCRNKFDERQVSETKSIASYDMTKQKYEVGQWVDVKDTIDQWLEAQVVQVRNNQAYVHYNGWGVRWDEWIDFSSPKIAPFKTYTVQSPSSVFMSPYPSVPCDANVEPQHRTIDSFYYLDKSANFMNEISKVIEYTSKLRKKNINRWLEMRQESSQVPNNEEKIKKDLHEAREKESQSRINNNFSQLSQHDHELIHMVSYLIPMMDRCGRLMSDLSNQLSHLVLNPNLYPQLLLGYNQNIEVSDTLSCTSGYSMYTNEGSILSGMTQHDHNIMNNLHRGNIQNSNQMINNYQNNNNINSSNTGNSGPTTRSYNIGNSSTELPFIQRLQSSLHHNTNTQTSNDNYPRVNLQVPTLLTPGEVVMMNGYNPYQEPNIDIYVHTLVSPNTGQNLAGNTGSNTTTQNANASQTTSTQNVNSNPNRNNVVQNESSNLSETQSDLITNLQRNRENSVSNQQSNQVGNNTAGNNGQASTSTATQGSSTIFNSLLGNIMNMIGSQGSNRRGSVTSETSNTSRGVQANVPLGSHINNSGTNTTVQNNNFNVTNNNINNNIFNLNIGGSERPHSSTNLNNQVQTTNDNMSRFSNNSGNLNNPIIMNPIYRDSATQTEHSGINLLSLNRDTNYNDNISETISNKSNKSEKNYSMKNKNPFSYKSVSEISEFEEYEEGEASDFVIKTKPPKTQSNKLNESSYSQASSHSKENFDEREETNDQEKK